MAWVGVLAHELSHIILLRPGLVDRNQKDMALTDLLTVFVGFGIFFSKNNSGTRLGDTPTGGMK